MALTTNEQTLLDVLTSLKYIQRGIIAADICIKLNQPYDKVHFISNVYGLKIQWDRISNIALMLPTQSKEHKMKMTAHK